MKRMITPDICYSPEEKGYIMYDASPYIPRLNPIMIDDVMFYPKGEYHVSLVAARKVAQQNPEQEAAIVRLVTDYATRSDTTLEWGGLGDTPYVCQKLDENGELQQSVIVPAHIVGIEGLWRVLRRDFGIAPNVPHVTLLTSANCPHGIGVNSQLEFATRCKSRPDLADKLQFTQ